MPRFKHYNYNQDAMVVINYQEQLQPCTFEHGVLCLIEHKLDLSMFHPKYRNEDTDRLAYDPGIYTNGRSLAMCRTTDSAAGTRSSRTRKPSKASYTDWMKHRVDSPQGKEVYSHLMSVVEPVFGNIGTNKGLNRFSLWSKKKVQGQWQLYCLVHNIEKLAHYGRMDAKTGGGNAS